MSAGRRWGVSAMARICPLENPDLLGHNNLLARDLDG